MPKTHTFIRCRYCKQEVFHGAKRCPNCRHRLHRSRHFWIAAAIIAVLVTLMMAHWMSNVEKPPVPREIDSGLNSVADAVLLSYAASDDQTRLASMAARRQRA